MRELRELDLGSITETSFLSLLIHSLEAVVRRGLDLGQYTGWESGLGFWGLGGLERVWLVRDESGEEADPDYVGIAPSVKLLHSAVTRLVEVDVEAASNVVRRWLHTESPVHLRLWAALAQDDRLATPVEVKQVLLHLNDREVWLADSYREVAALRALRFCELDSTTQESLLARLRRGPQDVLWPDADAERLKEWCLEVAVREIRRIRNGGCTLPPEVGEWLDAVVAERPELESDGTAHGSVPEGEPGLNEPQTVRELVQYRGRALLAELEQRLAAEEPFYSGRESAWLKNEAAKVLAVMAEEAGSGLAFPHLWRALGLQHLPPRGDTLSDQAGETGAEATKVVVLLATLDDKTLSQAIEELSFWWMRWERVVKPGRVARRVWLRLWLHAVDSTNAKSGGMSFDHQLLNTPAGRLASAVLWLAPRVAQGCRLSDDPEFSEILASIQEAKGNANLLGLAHLSRHIAWLLRTDREWAEQHLVVVLKGANGARLPVVGVAMPLRAQRRDPENPRQRRYGASGAHRRREAESWVTATASLGACLGRLGCPASGPRTGR